MRAGHYPLVIGLGNPGLRYHQTRHNIGFDVLDFFACQRGFENQFHTSKRGPSLFSRHEGITLVKPWGYMNRSGVAVQSWLDWLKLKPEQLLVVVDDFVLSLGDLRVRPYGSHGGHNGLRSVQSALGTCDYARLRCGVGPIPSGISVENFVLSRFHADEMAVRQTMLERASAALSCCQSEGIDVAMNQFNAKTDAKRNQDANPIPETNKEKIDYDV